VIMYTCNTYVTMYTCNTYVTMYTCNTYVIMYRCITYVAGVYVVVLGYTLGENVVNRNGHKLTK
jgi:hypothetical protein